MEQAAPQPQLTSQQTQTIVRMEGESRYGPWMLAPNRGRCWRNTLPTKLQDNQEGEHSGEQQENPDLGHRMKVG